MRRVFLVISALVVALLAATYYSHRYGLCMAELRFLSEQELIDAAIADEIEPNHLLGALSPPMDIDATPIRYESVAQFRELNPGCCRILSGSDEREALHVYWFVDRLFGYHSATVQLKYRLRYRDSNGNEGVQDAESTIPVSSCGKIHLESLRGG